MKMLLLLFYIAILVANLFLIISRNHSRFIAVLSVVFTCIIMGLNTHNADMGGYAYYYRIQSYPDSFEKGYVLVSKLMYSMGMPYQAFCFILFSVMIVGITIIVGRVFPNYHAVFFYYMLYSISLDVPQIRNAFAVMFYVVAVYFLSKENKKSLLFFIGVFLATMFHSSFIFVFPIFIFSKIKNPEKILKIIVVVSLILGVIMIVLNRQLLNSVLNVIISYVIENKQGYFTTLTNRAAYCIFFQIVNLFIVDMFYRYIRKSFSSDSIQFRFSRCTQIAVYYSTLIVPILVINANFLRIVRNNNLLICIVMTIVLASMDKNEKFKIGRFMVRKPIYYMLYFSFVISWIVGYWYFPGMVDIFNNNVLLGT